MHIGDTVKYSKRFLQSIGVYSGDMPQAKGTIISLEKFGQTTLASVNWNVEDLPRRVNVANLSTVRQIQLSADA